jgi:hypothetical protein
MLLRVRMRSLVASALLALAACAAPPQPPPPAASEDTCGMARHAHLIGVHENDIDRARLPPGTRIICPTCLVTQDYAPARLNLFTSTEGRISSMRCG